MNMRRAGAAFAATLLAVSLAACGGDDDGATAQDAAAPAAGAEPGAAEPGAAEPGAAEPGAAGGAAGGEAPPKTLVMADFAFMPTEFTVAPSEKWTVDNQDVALHDARSAELGEMQEVPKAKQKPIWSGDVAAGAKGAVTWPAEAGKYEFVCYYHQNMTGTVTVK